MPKTVSATIEGYGPDPLPPVQKSDITQWTCHICYSLTSNRPGQKGTPTLVPRGDREICGARGGLLVLWPLALRGPLGGQKGENDAQMLD